MSGDPTLRPASLNLGLICLALAVAYSGCQQRPVAPGPTTPPGPVEPDKPAPPASRYGLTEAVVAAARPIPDSPARARGLCGSALAFRTTIAQPIADAKALAADLEGRVAFWCPPEEHDAIAPVFDAINGGLNALTKAGTLGSADDYRAAFREVLAGLEASR